MVIVQVTVLHVPNQTVILSLGFCGGVGAGGSMTTYVVLIWEDKMCRTAEILMVHENCVAKFFCSA